MNNTKPAQPISRCPSTPGAHSFPEAGRADGFTLIEALVVIAILILLAAILAPAIGRAQRAGDRVACLSNLRQLHLAAASFHLDKQAFPDWQHWHMDEADGMGLRPYFFQGPIPSHERGVATITTSPVIDRRMKSWSPTRTNYALNIHASNHPQHGLRSPLAVQEPTGMMHFMYGATDGPRADGLYFFTKFVYHLQSGAGSMTRERYWDDGWSSVVYMDGHAGRISRTQGEALGRRNDPESRLFWMGRRSL